MDDKIYLWDLYDESTKEAFENKAISKSSCIYTMAQHKGMPPKFVPRYQIS